MLVPEKLNLSYVVQVDPDVMAAEADKDLVMVSLASGSYYGVSDIARAIWEAIQQPKRISDLIDDLTLTYDVDRSRCEEETLLYLRDLQTERLLQVKDGPAC